MSSAPIEDALQCDLDLAVSLADAAGRRVLELRDSGRWEGRTLADIGDQAADGYLQGFLCGRHPEDGLLSEETVDSPERLERERAWIVDPLDGTKEYSQGRDDWAVHVALTLGGECAVGAVALPSLGRTLFGVSLPGQERAGILNGDGQPAGDALLAGDSEPRDTPRIVCSRSHTPPWMEAFAATFGAELLPCGSAGYKVSRLLLGEADVYVHKVGLKEWDTCAPETVARALGWHVSKLRGEEHRYNRRDPRNHELVVCRPAWRERVLEAIEASGALE